MRRPSKRMNDPMSAVADIDTAQSWTKRLLKYERDRTGQSCGELRASVARRVGVSPGTIENVQRGRIKEPRKSLMDKLRVALVKELQSEVMRHEHEIHILKQTGSDPRDSKIAEVETSLEKIRQTLGGVR
jgi:transcriptional regulator with XRE-family HTH domain